MLGRHIVLLIAICLSDGDIKPIVVIVCPLEPAVPGGCGGSKPVYAEATGSQPGRPFAPGQLHLSCRSVAEGKMIRVMME